MKKILMAVVALIMTIGAANSPGNLQYQASTGIWRFAEHQYDYIGSGNENISTSYSGWIDLFGWGTGRYNGQSVRVVQVLQN